VAGSAHKVMKTNINRAPRDTKSPDVVVLDALSTEASNTNPPGGNDEADDYIVIENVTNNISTVMI
jgi:hypothetical protein